MVGLGILCVVGFFSVSCLGRDCVEPYETAKKVEAHTKVDRALFEAWQKQGLPVPYVAADTVYVRRVYLSLAGRLPSDAEAKAFFADQSAGKYEKLVDTLLASENYVDYWSLKWCDALRVKSEFPINLWPNAVYVYHYRVCSFLKNNEPYDQFVRALLTASGSNFRVAEVNFYRAISEREPLPTAAAVAQTFMGIDFERLDPKAQTNMAAFFQNVTISKTQEWKEEIVYWKPGDVAQKLIFPNGTSKTAKAGEDYRALFADYLTAGKCPYFAKAAVNRVWYWLFYQSFYENPDDIHTPCLNEKVIDLLAEEFVASGYNFKSLVRAVANTAVMRASAIAMDTARSELALSYAAIYPLHRMDAEVVEDSIRDLTGTTFEYSSVIPEPFTFIPNQSRTVTLADGSISSQFLILFGRPARDSGLLQERNNHLNEKQLLYFYNSGDIYRRIGSIFQASDVRNLPPREKLEYIYWKFFARPPTDGEVKAFFAEYESIRDKRLKWRAFLDLCWSLLSSKEFLLVS
jgi:hypothetical protein